MPIDVNTLISQYGYWALFAGCLAEGETFTLLGGVAAHEGLLRYGWVVLTAMCGGVLGDTALFFAGRYYGESLLQRFSKHQQTVERAKRLIHQRPVLFVVGVRFMYGLRIVGPLIIGASRLSPRRFLLLNLCGAALWAVLFVSLGYFAGGVIAPWLHQWDHHLKHLVWLLLAVGLVWGARRWLKNRQIRQQR